MADEQEICLANGLFSRFMNVFDQKEYEYSRDSIYFRFNAYGHLLQIKLLKPGSLEELIIDTQDVLRQYNDVLNSLGIRGIEKFSKEISEKFCFVCSDFNAVSFLYKEKTDVYVNVISRIFFQAETGSLKMKVSADMKHINIGLIQQDITPREYIKSFADVYQKISVDLYELHKEIMDILKDENMSHNAIEHLVFTKGVRCNG